MAACATMSQQQLQLAQVDFVPLFQQSDLAPPPSPHGSNHESTRPSPVPPRKAAARPTSAPSLRPPDRGYNLGEDMPSSPTAQPARRRPVSAAVNRASKPALELDAVDTSMLARFVAAGAENRFEWPAADERNVLTDDSADGARRLRRQLVRRSRNAASITRLDVLTRQHMATVPRPGSGLRTYSSYSSLPSVAPMIHSYSVQTLLNPHDADKPWSKSRFVLNDRFSPAAVAVPQKKVTRVILADSEQQPKNASRSSAVPTGKYPLSAFAPGQKGLHNQNNKRPPSASKRPGVTPLAPPSHRPPPPQPPPPWPSNQPSRSESPPPCAAPFQLTSTPGLLAPAATAPAMASAPAPEPPPVMDLLARAMSHASRRPAAGEPPPLPETYLAFVKERVKYEPLLVE